ncbi:MAG: polyhydroxyalkanoate depolymerase [Aquabacterium sp.]|nr:polyhydroxyalkanoate depolymerase [Aquabacterium sp.]
MLYAAYQSHADTWLPLQTLAGMTTGALSGSGLGRGQSVPWRAWSAASEVIARLRLTHARPAFGIDTVTVGAPHAPREVAVREEVVDATPFGSLLHFRRDGVAEQPRVLLVAPMSGHFATLLRETVRTLLQDHDVYLTDWANARQVPLAAGRFGLDEYVEHVMRFVARIGPGAHLMAICQPCVPALAAAALMAQDAHPAQPRTLSLLAGPVDCRINPTKVNELATSKPYDWFERHMIHRVPWRHRGAGRRVYPGFLQLTAFMSMNLQRHLDAFAQLFRHLRDGEDDAAQAIAAFYEEYFAVADLPAEFYLETIRRVFQDYDLARGTLTWRGNAVDPSAIRRTAIFTVEGERDDICSIGQTVAAQDLCSRVRPSMREHHMQAGVGHYGVFSGRRWRGEIYPRLRDMINCHDGP